MFEIKNLIKEYKNIIAVNNISFKVIPGEIFGLLGPNGAGKTTIIRIILNIIKPTSGYVLYNGKEIHTDLQNIIGYLPEERGLYRKSKVINVIRYFAELKGMNRLQAAKSARKWLERFDIADLASKKVEELSKGNQQKVQFITAVIHNPQILILDEPFSGLDLLTQQMVKDIFYQFMNSGKIIILSSHMTEIAEQLCSEILLINKGEKILDGTIRDIKNQYSSDTYKLEFDGNPSYLKYLPGINFMSVQKNIAELKLEKNYTPGELLKNAVTLVKVKSFIKVEQSLNNIIMKVLAKG